MKSALLILFILIPIGLFMAGRQIQSQPSAEPLPLATVENPPPLYSIDDLQNRSYPAGRIAIERDAPGGSGFISYVVSFQSENLKQYALMNVPDQNLEKYPVIILNHGYIPPEIYSTTESYRNISAYFAQSGFLVLKPDYRGHDRSEAGEETHLNRLAYAVDVLHLLASLENLALADTDHIFLYGHSMGGDVALRVLSVTDRIKAASLWAPVAEEFPESMYYFLRKNRSPEELEEVRTELESRYSSKDYPSLTPLNYLDRITAKIIIRHGTADESVPFEWGQNLAAKLSEAGVTNEFVAYEGANHDLVPSYSEARQADIAFFRTYLPRQAP